MERKKYQKPSVEVENISMMSILVVSGSTGATGEDAPWAAKGRGMYISEPDNAYDWNKVN